MKKTERLLAIVLALKQYGKMTACQIAELLEVNIRTIYRDVDALSQMNVPLVAATGSKGGYEILDHYFLPSISFGRDEVLALMISKKLIDRVCIPGFGPHIQSAFLKIQNLMDRKMQQEHETITHRLIFDITGMAPEMMEHQYFEDIRQSFSENKTLRITYYSPKKMSTSNREILPYVLLYFEGCWYLNSFCMERNSERTFRLDRITRLSMTDNTYDLGKEYNFSQFERAFQYKNEAISRIGTRIRLKMEIPLYEREKDKLEFKYVPIVTKKDHVILDIMTPYESAVLSYAVKEYEQAEILTPQRLRDELKSRLKKIIEKYS